MSTTGEGPVALPPSGTVTFLFTDVEGSTVRWEHDPAQMSSALDSHDSILRSTIEANGGYVFAAGGDGFAAAFRDALSALRAAFDSQSGLPLPVRMGLHTGTAEERGGNYYGRSLNRAARIMAAGHGGQILLSDVTAGLVRDDDVELTDLGDHRLAGMEAPMRLWQVGREGFPPLRTASHAAGNLPLPLDRFVGRAHEIMELSDRLKTQRLVTVVGVGGMGKTRFAVEALHRSRLEAPDGVWFADLTRANSGQAVVHEVASLFRLQASPGRSIEDRLVEHLEDKHAVLVFDNCEHVVRPAADLIDLLLHAGPSLRIVATSREALMLRGEHVMTLGPLSIDAATEGAGREGAEVESVDLFLDRVIAEGGPADVVDQDRGTVLDICRQLDGMPLAIELAAARARTLGAAGVLDHLGESMTLLSGGWRTSAGRQQTLAATLDWSYVLLDEREQFVFDRLAVFVGWFTLDDAVAVCGDEPSESLDVIDALSGLVDKSMCASDLSIAPARYRYLETMRAYGRDHLSEAGTLPEYRDRHATHLANAARRIRRAIVGPDELQAAREAKRITADLRSALGWAVDRHLDDVINDIADIAIVMESRGDYEMGSWFYDLRDDFPENGRIQSVAVSHAFYVVGDVTEMRRLAERLIELDDGAFAAAAWQNLGFAALNEGAFEQAVEYHLRTYQLVEEAPDELFDHIMNPVLLALILSATGRDATEFIDQARARADAANWPTGIAWANCAAGLHLAEIDANAGIAAWDSAIEIAAGVGSRSVETIAQNFKIFALSTLLLPPDELAVELVDLLRRLQQIGDNNTSLLALSQVVVLLDKLNRHESAAVICGWLDGRSGRNVQSAGEHIAAVTTTKQSLSDKWEELVERGLGMTRNQVIDFACDALATPR